FDLALEPADLESGAVRADRETLLLVVPDRGGYLPLAPWAQYQVGAQGAYFLNGLEWASARRPARLKKAGYLGYNCRQPLHVEQAPGFVAECLERQVDRLLAVTAPVEVAAGPTAEGDPDLTLPEVVEEQRRHLKGFAGRAELLGKLAAWIDGKAGGGYLLLLGP